MGTMAKVRGHISNLKGKNFSSAEVARALNIANVTQVQHSFIELQKQGEIERVSYGRYRFIRGKLPILKPDNRKAKIFRAMHIKGLFSASEITVLTEASRDFIYQVIEQLLKSDDLEGVGMRKNLNGRYEKTYRVRHRDEFYKYYVLQRISRR